MSADTEVLQQLRQLGNGDATAGFRSLCALAFVCSVCLQRWDRDSRCGCGQTTARNKQRGGADR